MEEVRLRILGECVIEVGGEELTPQSVLLFPLLLLLALEPVRGWSRTELQEMLFGEATEGTSHRLRQGLYRLRGMGVGIARHRDGRLRLSSPTVSPEEDLLQWIPDDIHPLHEAVIVLPSFRSSNSVFESWLEERREGVEARIRTELHTQINRVQSLGEWDNLRRVCAALLCIDPHNDSVRVAYAEALALCDKRREALDSLNILLKRLDIDTRAAQSARQLKRRIEALSCTAPNLLLVGRTDELRTLAAEWERSKRSGPRLIELVGTPGIGKTTVVNAFANDIRLRGGVVLPHQCSLTTDHPLALLFTLVPQLRATSGSLGAAPHFKAILDQFEYAHAPSNMELTQYSPETSVQVRAALVDLVEAVAAERPLVITIDDAHALDEPSLHALLAIANATVHIPILIVTCTRVRCSRLAVQGTPPRYRHHVLAPLAPDAADQLLTALVAPQTVSEEARKRLLGAAMGNPFFVRVLAGTVSHRSDGVDIRAYAESLYYSLDSCARTVLESVLVLADHATLSRVEHISGTPRTAFIDALRRLEELGLVRESDRRLVGPHALIREELVHVIPTTVRSLLQERATAQLQAASNSHFTLPLALAAVDQLLSAGLIDDAAVLSARCAYHAAALGELKAALDILSKPHWQRLAHERQAILLEQRIAIATALGDQILTLTALDERLALGGDIGDNKSTTISLQFRRQEALGLLTGDTRASVNALVTYLEDQALSETSRCDVATRLLIAADSDLDPELASRAFRFVQDLARSAVLGAAAQRAYLVYHTTFGDQNCAHIISRQLLSDYPNPCTDVHGKMCRAYAAFSMNRRHDWDMASAILKEDYYFFREHEMHTASEYAASNAADAAFDAGSIVAAAEWVQRYVDARREYLLPAAAVHHTAALLLALAGRIIDARAVVNATNELHPWLQNKRTAAAQLADSVRLSLMALESPQSTDVESLTTLYERGRTFGGFDSVAEVLLRHECLVGNASRAQRLLRTYLRTRRETGPFELILGDTIVKYRLRTRESLGCAPREIQEHEVQDFLARKFSFMERPDVHFRTHVYPTNPS